MHTFFNPNAPFPTWQQFLARPDNKGLNVMQAKQKYLNEQANYYRMIPPTPSFASAAGGAGSTDTGPTFTNRFALNFDGSDDVVETSDGVTSYLNGVSQMSFSLWFNLDAAVINKAFISDRPVGNNNATNGHFNMFTKTVSGDNYSARLYLTHPDSVEASIQISGTPFTAGQWHNLVMTFNAGTVKFYVDGSAVSSGIYRANNGIPTTLGSTGKALTIGKSVGTLFWDGKIDEPAIYLTELTSDQVTTIYNQGVPGDISSLNPVAWYRFEEGSGTTAIDAGSGGNDATISGATYSTDIPS